VDIEPSIFGRVGDFLSALWTYWWALVPGGTLAIVPIIETHVSEKRQAAIDSWWPKEGRSRHIRWASAAAVPIAAFLAFDDVSTRNRALQRQLVSAERATGLVHQRHLDEAQQQKLKAAMGPFAKEIRTIATFTEGAPEQARYIQDFIKVFKELEIEVREPISGYGALDNDRGVMVGLLDINHPSDLAVKFIKSLESVPLEIKRVEWLPKQSGVVPPGMDFDLFIGAAH
jgi:hypothetical protein